MIVAEFAQGRLATITKEMLGCGRKLADDSAEELSIVVIGSGVTEPTHEAISYGADKVYTIDNTLFKDYLPETFANAIEIIVKQVMPSILIMGQTSTGRDLAPRLAFKLGTSATTDCIGLTIDATSKQLLQTKPVYGANVMATFTSKFCPQIVAIRANVYSALEADISRKGKVISIDSKLDLAPIKTKIVKRGLQIKEGIKLEDAEIVIAGGRGIGSTEGFEQLEELALLLKGAVGATRPPCDNGWVHESAQVGLTGKIITPELYFAIALSGSSQHISGCSGAKNIIAINKDAEANIFKVSRFGIIDDWKKILPTFTERVRELLAE
jgi:electron transfer flavoprotein alpha subunit